VYVYDRAELLEQSNRYLPPAAVLGVCVFPASGNVYNRRLQQKRLIVLGVVT
jgi:hypothetical protein